MGAAVGRSDGAAVGSQVEAWLEAWAGSRVGSCVGSQVGSWVGDVVGFRVGSWVGFPGEIVHDMVGCPRERVLPGEDDSRCVFLERYLCLRLFMLPWSQLNHLNLFANTAERARFLEQ